MLLTVVAAGLQAALPRLGRGVAVGGAVAVARPRPRPRPRPRAGGAGGRGAVGHAQHRVLASLDSSVTGMAGCSNVDRGRC